MQSCQNWSNFPKDFEHRENRRKTHQESTLQESRLFLYFQPHVGTITKEAHSVLHLVNFLTPKNTTHQEKHLKLGGNLQWNFQCFTIHLVGELCDILSIQTLEPLSDRICAFPTPMYSNKANNKASPKELWGHTNKITLITNLNFDSVIPGCVEIGIYRICQSIKFNQIHSDHISAGEVCSIQRKHRVNELETTKP